MRDKEPEYIICKECESPCYNFEFRNGKLLSAFCTVCGNDETDEFEIPEESR